MIKISLHWKILIAMLLGLIWALASENLNLVSFNILWISPFGDIFMKLLKLIAVPLVLFSIIKGVSNLSSISELGKMGTKTILLYLTTTCFAVFIGLFLVNQIGPGKGFNIGEFEKNSKVSSIQEQVNINSEESPLKFIVDMVPENIFLALGDNKAMLQIIFFAIFFGSVLILIDTLRVQRLGQHGPRVGLFVA